MNAFRVHDRIFMTLLLVLSGAYLADVLPGADSASLWDLAWRWLICSLTAVWGVTWWRRRRMVPGILMTLPFACGTLWYGFLLLFFGLGGSR